MDRRSELRFQIYTSARVALFDMPEREMDAQMVDVSASGVRFHLDAELLEDQIITIETDQHLILADVRNCKARGVRFGVGAERVHSAAKFSLPRTASKAERNQALVADYHRRLQDELEKPAVPNAHRPAGAAAYLTVEPNPPAAAVEPLAPNPVGQDSPTKAATVPVSPAPPSPWKGRVTALLSLLAVAILLLSLPGLFGHHVPAASRSEAAGTSPVPVLVVDSAVPQPSASRAGHSVVAIGSRGRSWVMVCADSRMVYSKMLDAGNHDSVEFAERAVVRLGNAGLVDLQLDGKPLGTLGQAGQARIVELTPESSRIFAEGESGGCSSAQ